MPGAWSGKISGQVYKVVLQPDEDVANEDYPSKRETPLWHAELTCVLTTLIGNSFASCVTLIKVVVPTLYYANFFCSTPWTLIMFFIASAADCGVTPRAREVAPRQPFASPVAVELRC